MITTIYYCHNDILYQIKNLLDITKNKTRKKIISPMGTYCGTFTTVMRLIL